MNERARRDTTSASGQQPRATLSSLFTWRSAVVESSVSANAKHVALTLSLHMSERGDSCFPSLQTLVDETGRGRATIIAATKELVEAGLLEVDRGGQGRGARNRYRAIVSEEHVESFLAARPRLADKGSPPRTLNRDFRVPRASDKGSEAVPEDVIEDVHLEPSAPSGAVEPVGSTPTAQDLVAFFVDESRRRGSDPPSRVRGHLAREVKRLLDEGVTPERVTAGLGRMLERRIVQPGLLPNFVAEADLPAAGSRGGMTASEIMAAYRGQS